MVEKKQDKTTNNEYPIERLWRLNNTNPTTRDLGIFRCSDCEAVSTTLVTSIVLLSDAMEIEHATSLRQ